MRIIATIILATKKLYLAMLTHSPWFLDQIPNGICQIIIDMADDVDDADEEPEQRIHEPTIGHVAG